MAGEVTRLPCMQELEQQNRRLMASQTEVSGSPADYMPRADHQRILGSRLEGQASEHKTELGNRLAQVERECRWRFEAQAAERDSATQAELRQVRRQGHMWGAQHMRCAGIVCRGAASCLLCMWAECACQAGQKR